MKKRKSQSGPAWKGRSLENYKALNMDKAKASGKEKELRQAKTLTAARKIMSSSSVE